MPVIDRGGAVESYTQTMAKSKRPTHCFKCGNKLTREEIPPASERGPETWCFACCEQADANGEGGGMSTYAVAVLGYQGRLLD
jgi:hypothetical protein